MDLSIILINHNKAELTAQTITSVQKTASSFSYEIIVIDNSVSPDMAYSAGDDDVKVYGNIENKGFGHACNLGASYAKGTYLLFLNNDTILHSEALEKSLNAIKHNKKIGALGIRTLLQDGTLDHGCKRGFPTPMNSLYYFLGFDRRNPTSEKYGAYRQTFVDEKSIKKVDAVSGSFMFMPKAVFEQVNGFDTDYFMYGEDLDLCYRVREAGYEVVYYGEASMTHLKGQSGLNTNPDIVRHFYNAMVLFYNKHYRDKYSFITNALVKLGIYIKRWISIRKCKARIIR